MTEKQLVTRHSSKIVAVHVSYRSRAMERGTLAPWPSYFLKAPNTLAASGDPVARLRAARLRGRGRADHRPPRHPGKRPRRVGLRRLGEWKPLR